jgi:hypothetical protein
LKLVSSRRIRAVLAILAVLLIISGVSPFLNHDSIQVKNAGLIQASGSSDPIATGTWQQDQYDSFILQLSQNQGLNPFLVKGQIMVESNFNTNAISSVLNSACQDTHDEGLMQVNPVCMSTGSANLFDPWTNLYYGTQGLAYAYAQLGDMSLAIQAYNLGVQQVEIGARNWAYYDAVMSYAQQFENEHCQNYGCGGSSSTSTTTSSIPPPSCEPLGYSTSTYTVEAGDTLGCIAQKTEVSMQTLANLNNIGAPYVVYPGEVLRLTEPATTTQSSSTQTVQSSGSTTSSSAISTSTTAQMFERSFEYARIGRSGQDLQDSNVTPNNGQETANIGSSYSNNLTALVAMAVIAFLIGGNILLTFQRRTKGVSVK